MVVGPAVIVSELLTTDVVNPDFVAVSVAVLVFVLMLVLVLVLPMLVPAVLVPVAVAVPDPLRLREQAAARFWLPVPATNWFPAAGHL